MMSVMISIMSEGLFLIFDYVFMSDSMCVQLCFWVILRHIEGVWLSTCRSSSWSDSHVIFNSKCITACGTIVQCVIHAKIFYFICWSFYFSTVQVNVWINNRFLILILETAQNIISIWMNICNIIQLNMHIV